ELGANLVWLLGSELLAPGLEVRWALNEGFYILPDIAIRGSVNHVVGNRDVNMTVTGLDLQVSKSFGFIGSLNLAPYLSWAILFASASSRVLDPTPTDEADVGKNVVLPELTAGDNIHQKLTLGVRLLVSLLNLSVQ